MSINQRKNNFRIIYIRRWYPTSGYWNFYLLLHQFWCWNNTPGIKLVASLFNTRSRVRITLFFSVLLVSVDRLLFFDHLEILAIFLKYNNPYEIILTTCKIKFLYTEWNTHFRIFISHKVMYLTLIWSLFNNAWMKVTPCRNLTLLLTLFFLLWLGTLPDDRETRPIKAEITLGCPMRAPPPLLDNIGPVINSQFPYYG